MLPARWIVSIAVLICAAWIMSLNWVLFWRGWILGEKTSSLIPFIGAVAGAIGLLLLPVRTLHWLWWAPFILDWGSLPAVTVPLLLHRRRRME